MSQNGILNRANYDKKTLDTYEILGSYFVDIYYNYLYIEATKLKTERRAKSITEGYKHSLTAYLHAFEKDQYYTRTLNGIHAYFLQHGFSSITFTQCIEKIMQEFIPSDFYTSVNKSQKISLLKYVLKSSNSQFIEKLVRKHIGMVIDNHEEPENARMLQDEFVDILIMERAEMFHRFIGNKTVKNTGNAHVLESMQKEIKNLYAEKHELKRTNLGLKKIVLNKENEIKNYIKVIDTLKSELVKTKPLGESSVQSVSRETPPIRVPQSSSPMPIPSSPSVADSGVFSSSPMEQDPFLDNSLPNETPANVVLSPAEPSSDYFINSSSPPSSPSPLEKKSKKVSFNEFDEFHIYNSDDPMFSDFDEPMLSS